jgi:hypothetical protein
VETAYVAPAAGVANAAPPIVGTIPLGQPANLDAAIGMSNAAIDALGTSFNVIFAGNNNQLNLREATLLLSTLKPLHKDLRHLCIWSCRRCSHQPALNNSLIGGGGGGSVFRGLGLAGCGRCRVCTFQLSLQCFGTT